MLSRLKTLSIKGLAWAASESIGVALLSLGVFTVMARLLEPEHFGVVALAGVFIFTFNMIIGHSFADVIVQRVRIDPEDLDTAFWTNLGLSLVLLALCWLGAAGAAAALGEPRLAEVLPWLALVIPLNAAGIVQTALFRRELKFRAVALRSLTGRAVGSVVGIAMAVSGYGVWSLVGQQLAGAAVVTLAMAAASPWRPRFRYSVPHLRKLWGFGANVSASQIVIGLGEQAINLLIGAIFGSVILGYFNIAWRVTELIRSFIASAVYHVGFSAFARLQEDRTAVAKAFLQVTRLSCLFGFPIAAGMSLLAEPIVFILFGRRWEPSVPVLTVLALNMIPAFYGMFFSACYRAMDRAGWVLALSILYLAAGVAAVLAAAPFGIVGIAAAWVAKSVILIPVHVALLCRLLRVPLAEAFGPVAAPLAATTVMAAALAALLPSLLDGLSEPLRIAVGAPLGALIYAATVYAIAPQLFFSAARTARIMVTPQGASGG